MNDIHSHEVIYDSHSHLSSPGRLFRDMRRDLFASRGLAWRLFVREISTRYRQTALGYFWAILPVIVNSIIFIFLNSSNLMNVKDIGVPYPVYVIMGTTFFALFIDALNAPLKIIMASRGMLVKINFPKEAIVLAGMGEVAFNFAIKTVLLVITLLYFKITISSMAFIVCVPLFGLFLIGSMLGVFLVPLGMLFQDFAYALMMISSAIMFLTPVGYPPPSEGLLALVNSLNPLTPLLMASRDFLLTGSSPYTLSMMIIMTLCLLLFFVGWVLLRLSLPIVIERLGG